VRRSPFWERERDLGAVFYETAGWERPHWYASNEPLVEEFEVAGREAEWDSRWWSPIINGEHLAMRDRVAMFDLTAFCIFDVISPGALESVQRVALRQMDVKLGKVVYTPVLTPRGGFRSDLTIMRLADDQFRVVTGGAHGMADLKWFRDHLVGDAQVFDVTSQWCTLGLWGPRARDILASTTGADVSHEGFPFATCRDIEMGPLRVLASRISYVGDLGWELYVPIDQGARLWDIVAEAGEPHGTVPAGIGVYGTTGRLEKCYRAFGFELDGEYDVVEAGMAWGKVKDQDFVGKEAHDVPADDALDVVHGYLCGNDVSARDLQFGDRQWFRGKSQDTFCPIGPGIVPKLTRTPGAVRWSAPWTMGSHNDEIYGDVLGLGADERASLREAGVI